MYIQYDIVSVVIVKHGNKGYTASLRFADKTRDVDIAKPTHDEIIIAVERCVQRTGRWTT